MIWLGNIPKKNAKLYPNEECVVFEGTRLKWIEFNERINRFANRIHSLGLKKGDHVAVLMENCHQYLEIYYGLAKIGLVTVPLNFRLSEKEISYIIHHSDSVAFILGKEYIDMGNKMRPELEKVKHYISVDKPSEGMILYDDLIQEGEPTEPDEKIDENDMVILMYTGGTTGKPKGVMLSHRNILTSCEGAVMGMGAKFKMLREDRNLFVLPLFHIANWTAFSYHYIGACVIINRRPGLEEILRLIEEEKPTHMHTVPTIYNWLLQAPGIEKRDFNSFRLLSYGGSPMPIEVLRKCIKTFGPIFLQGYGLTETSPMVSVLSEEDHILEGTPEKVNRLKSAGRELPNVMVRVVREDETEVRPGEVGEITVCGKNVMLGYWKDPDLTTKTIINGWLHTGDMATVDEEGYFYIVDRKHDMIITGGENVYSIEVENVLYQHPAILEAAVVGVPDVKWGESVKGVVALKPGCIATQEEIITFCKRYLAGYKCPKSIEFLDVLPKTSVGKILRRELRKKYWEGQEKQVH